MNVPGFSAEASLYRSGGYSRHGQSAVSHIGTIVPAIPLCSNCPHILNMCEKLGWPHSALCEACLSGDCESGPPPR
jgi:hypothetical protein